MKVILFGAPGSGKGTQTAMLCEHLNLEKVSLGDILRDEVKKNSSLGGEVSSYMNKGALVPDELVARLIEENISGKNFLLDGYPRNFSQAENLEKILSKSNKNIDLCIYLNTEKELIIDRLSKRRVCPNCGANYHLKNMPPKKNNVCDGCDSNLIQRKDDTPEVIEKRWEVFSAESKKVLDFYQNKGNLLSVDANGEKDVVFERIKEKLK